MKIHLLIYGLFALTLSCSGQSESKKVSEVAEYFLIEDVYINSFIVSDKDIDELYQNNREWVKLYFPQILKQYDLTLYSQFSIACMLYIEGDQEYLIELWDEHKRLKVNDEFKPVLHLLKHYEIELK
jgi:hypothetical protein